MGRGRTLVPKSEVPETVGVTLAGGREGEHRGLLPLPADLLGRQG